jgi:hypothetical protein
MPKGVDGFELGLDLGVGGVGRINTTSPTIKLDLILIIFM